VLEDGGKRSTLTGGSPSSDDEISTALLVLGWEFGGGDVVVVKERFAVAKEEKSDVVGEGPAVVVLVDNDSGDLSPLLIVTSVGTVVFASNNGDGGWGVSFDAMGSGNGKGGSDDGGTTDVGTEVMERQDVRELSFPGIFTSNDLTTSWHFPLSTRHGRSGGDEAENSDESENLHDS